MTQNIPETIEWIEKYLGHELVDPDVFPTVFAHQVKVALYDKSLGLGPQEPKPPATTAES